MNSFLKGMATGMAIGCAVAMTTGPMMKKTRTRNGVSRALKAMGEIAENVGEMFRA